MSVHGCTTVVALADVTMEIRVTASLTVVHSATLLTVLTSCSWVATSLTLQTDMINMSNMTAVSGRIIFDF